MCSWRLNFIELSIAVHHVFIVFEVHRTMHFTVEKSYPYFRGRFSRNERSMRILQRLAALLVDVDCVTSPGEVDARTAEFFFRLFGGVFDVTRCDEKTRVLPSVYFRAVAR